METHPGFCPCCRTDTEFVIHGPWLRDQYLCSLCGSSPRQRHLLHILDRHFPGWETRTIHESSPSNRFLAERASAYTYSHFLPEVPNGEYSSEGIRSENLEALSFPSESFDIFITQDVLEHVFHPDVAAREIHRVLRKGGFHIFTAPKHKSVIQSYARATLVDGVVTHLHPEEYHGNPVGDGRALVTWDYGHDFEQLISEWSGMTTTTYVTRDRTFGIDAEYIEVFVSHRPAA